MLDHICSKRGNAQFILGLFSTNVYQRSIWEFSINDKYSMLTIAIVYGFFSSFWGLNTFGAMIVFHRHVGAKVKALLLKLQKGNFCKFDPFNEDSPEKGSLQRQRKCSACHRKVGRLFLWSYFEATTIAPWLAELWQHFGKHVLKLCKIAPTEPRCFFLSCLILSGSLLKRKHFEV